MVKFNQIVLIVLDGLGVASPSEGNAVTASYPRNLNFLINNFPVVTLQACGPSVGLPWGARGNSEVGHLNLGAGRIVRQDLPRINHAISSGEFYRNEALLKAFSHATRLTSALHLVGLVSPGGVHSSEDHLFALLGMAKEQNCDRIFIHFITDGRDTPPKAALESLDRLSRKILESGRGKIATIAGRFYAMDRGRHLELTDSTFKAMVLGEGATAASARGLILDYYQKEIYDEMIPPTVLMDRDQPVGRIKDNDAVIFFNFRPDRMRQLSRAIINSGLKNVFYATFTRYEKNLEAAAAFPPLDIRNGLAETLSKNGLRQFHIAESEKYAHVTSFFNGGIEEPWPREEREIVTSPARYKKSYEDVPEMSSAQVGEKAVEKLSQGINFILVNFANPDMVGHTGSKTACISAIAAVDRALGLIYEKAAPLGACVMVTADHGNIEEVIDPRTGVIDKEHSLNPVPFIVAGKGLERRQPLLNGYQELPKLVPEGVLSDVAPTILELMDIPKPPEMTAVSLWPSLISQI